MLQMSHTIAKSMTKTTSAGGSSQVAVCFKNYPNTCRCLTGTSVKYASIINDV